MTLGILWASQANTIPAAFWTLAFVLRDPQARAEIVEEVGRVAAGSDRRRSTKDQLKQIVERRQQAD